MSISTCSPCLDSAAVFPTTTGASYVLGNWAPPGSTSKEACVNTRSSTCSNVPIGAELLHDQWLTCGACPTKCTADGDQMLIGTCNDEGSSGTTCETCAGDCRMDMTFSTDLYMTMTEFTVAKAALFLSAIKDSTKVPLTKLSTVSIAERSTLVSNKYITVTAKIVLSKTAAATSALTSKNPAFTASTLKTALIANGFTEKVADSVFNNFVRFGTHFTDKGTMMAISKPSHTKVEGIVVVTNEALEVQMKMELPYTKDSFDTDVQGKFLSAVANSVKTPVDNLYIKSVVEKASSRRVSRKLLAVSVEVNFAIRVQDATAQAAMITNEGLTEAKLNIFLAKQGLLEGKVVTKPAAPSPTTNPKPSPTTTEVPADVATKRDNTRVIVGAVVGCVGGGALIVAIVAYYLYFVKPKTRIVEDAPIVAPCREPLVTLVFDASDFTKPEKKEQPASKKDEVTVKKAEIEVSVPECDQDAKELVPQPASRKDVEAKLHSSGLSWYAVRQQRREVELKINQVESALEALRGGGEGGGERERGKGGGGILLPLPPHPPPPSPPPAGFSGVSWRTLLN
jgi:hypothetical protein